MNLESAQHLDFLRIPSLKRFVFSFTQNDRQLIEELGDLETIDDDTLAWRVRSHFEAIAQALGCLDIIRNLIPEETTVDAQAELTRRIDVLIQKAIRQNAPTTELEQLTTLKTMSNTVYWDTSWSAALEYWEGRYF